VTLARFFRTPKGVATLILAGLTIVAAFGEDLRLVALVVGGAVGAAMVFDVFALRMLRGRWHFPSGALLTGLIVAAVLSPHVAWWVSALTSLVGVAAKYVFRVKPANVFNPAALGLVVTFYPFSTGQSWWGALPDVSPYAIVLLLAAGIFMAYRVAKIPIVLSFLGVYYLLFTVMSFVGDPAFVSTIYRAPDLHAALYFAFFMVSDPPTSPPKARDQIIFGAIVAIACFAAFEWIHAVYFLAAGLLVGNVWEAWRRARLKAGRAARTQGLSVSPAA
jgi:Na+-translocating ferredoxin:NAD+ oxidoreductase RnfD subunit